MTKPLSLLQLLRYSDARDKTYLVFGSLVALVNGFSWNLLTIAFGDNVDIFVDYESQNRLNLTTNTTDSEFLAQIQYFSGSLFVLWILNSICNYIIMVLFPLAATNQIKTIKFKYFSSLLKQDIQWFDSLRDSDFASTVTADLKRIEEGMNEKLGLAIYTASTALIAIIVAFCYGWKLTLIIICLLPFLAFGTSVMNKVQSSFARKEVQAYSSAGTVAEEAISAIRTVLSFGAQNKEVQRYERYLWPALKSGIKRNFMTGLGNGLMFSCLYGGLALGIWFGVQMIIESRELGNTEYTIGTIVIVFWCVSGAGFSIGGAAPHFEAISVARAVASKVYEVIERKPLIDISCETGLKNEIKANIEFKDIHFSYPSRPQIPVLNGFSLQIKSGENVALVGPSGSGKSTIVQLLQRFYDPQNGKVLIDGIDCKLYNLGFLRENMGCVGQEPVLFDASIWQNIALGSHSKYIDQKDIEIAAKEANAHQFIEQLPEKYNTYCGDRGRQLSGGQKQRIAIARALINSPKILILDEATSALDLQSESIVQSALEKASKGRTTIVVAHRLSTVVNCDKIVFISSGKVREMGTHQQLMDLKGEYYNLVLKQQICEQTYGSEPEADSRPETQLEPLEEEDEEDFQDEEVVLKKFSQRRLWKLLSEDKYNVFLGLFLSLLYGLIVPIYAYIFGAFVEVFTQTSDPKEIWDRSHVFSYYYILIALSVGTISVTQMTVLGVAAERLTLRLRKKAFQAIMSQEIAFFDKLENSPGALCARLSADAANVQGASGSRMAIILQAFSTFATSAVLGFILNWQLSLVASLFIPFILIGSAVSASIDNWELKSNKQSLEKSTKIASEALLGIRTVQSLHREQHFIDLFQQIIETNAKTSRKKYFVRAFTLAFALSIVFLSYAVVFMFGGYLAVGKTLDSGNFFIIIETLIYGSMTVGQSSVFTSDYKKAKMAAANIFRLIDRKSLEVTKSGPLVPNQCSGNISFQKVKFSYPNRRQCQVLKGLSFDINSGQTVALVGSSGCGKSTSVQLLEKFYDVIGGQISIDGINLKDLNTEWCRQQMALVSQEPNLFSYSIRENISYGLENTPFEQIVRSAQKANIHEFIQDLPEQYETHVGSKGTQLSGGQKQRIAIARALMRDPKILLLDEATSALDTSSEKLVQDSLEEASKDRTCLVIAHRLSTVRNADKIVVLQRGVAVEEGTHEELIQRKGIYYDLNQLQ